MSTSGETGAPSHERTLVSKHLRQLEAESIEIVREVIAEFKHPVMLYSIGKDSSVMLHLAIKAFLSGAATLPAAAYEHDSRSSAK